MAPERIYDLLIEHGCRSNTIERVLIGLTWTLCQAGGTGLAMTMGPATRTLSWAGTLRGKAVMEVAPWLKSWQPHEAAVGMAAINAVINTNAVLAAQVQTLRYEGVPANLSVFEHFKDEMVGQRVAVIGRYPGLERYATELNLTIIERQPGAEDLPDPACEFVLPQMQWVFLSASTLVNKTFPRLAALSRNARTVLMGPTVPWLAEMKEFGVDFLAGVRIDDAEQICTAVAEGAGTRLFECGASYGVLAL